MIPRCFILLGLSLLVASSAGLSILQDKRRAVVVDLSRCHNPKAVQPNIQTIETNPTFDNSLCGLRDPSALCADAAKSQIDLTASPDGSVYTFHVPPVYTSVTAFVWLQEQAFPQYWDDPVKGVGGTIFTFENPGQSDAIVRAKGRCPNGEQCHEADGFEISHVYFQTKDGGVIGPDRTGVTKSEDPYERLIIEYC